MATCSAKGGRGRQTKHTHSGASRLAPSPTLPWTCGGPVDTSSGCSWDLEGSVSSETGSLSLGKTGMVKAQRLLEACVPGGTVGGDCMEEF